MIDWLTAVIPVRHRYINNGHIISVDRFGEEEWHTHKRNTCRGSFESAIQICSNDITECHQFAQNLFIDGNPTKFLQGHNVAGTDDVCLLAFLTVNAIFQQFELYDIAYQDGEYTPVRFAHGHAIVVNEFTERSIKNGNFSIKKIDINYMFELENQNDVDAYIDACAEKTRTRHGRALNSKGTVYWGKHSRRWAIKLYSKYNELLRGGKGHTLPQELINSPLLDYCRAKLRFELRLMKTELRKLALAFFDAEEFKASFFNTPVTDDEGNTFNLTPESLFNRYIARIDMNAQVPITGRKSLQLPTKVRGTYELWRTGHNVRDIISRPTFYRHRKELAQFGIDISLPPANADEHKSEVVPLVRILEARPASTSEIQEYLIN
ncbi:Replication-associated protein G2P [Pseudoalteromonas ruthenica]|uniref:phage/plasmid replication protein, II/X family n=1 Tax=Pseudoalteromonas ruthenica TaxID=151081 RepID=UPI000348F630|nr:phage/plasmid replication protein, II/X family [Pseudoalteromonas ruthenica]TLX51788.1 Replication-associated protein G2P [Pseudoalteromonas ruthenica]